MSTLLEVLGRGLESNFMRLILPEVKPMGAIEAAVLTEDVFKGRHDLATMLRVGMYHAENGATDRAADIFTAIVAQVPDHAETRLAWAAMYLWDASIEQAITQLELAQNQEQNDARICFALGHCYERLGQCDQAVEQYRAGIDQAPYLRQLRERIAAIHLFKNDYLQVIEQYQELSKEHPEEMWYYLVLGQLHLHQRSYEQAARAFERALTIEPDNFELRNEEVESLVESGHLEEAIDNLERIAAVQGEFPDSFVRLGDLYSQLENDESAVQSYCKALELHPGYLEAAVKLGTQHLRQKRFYQAANCFSRGVEINDQLINAYIGLGVAQTGLGSTDANETFNLAAALEPNTNLLFAETCRLQLKIAMTEKRRSGFDDFIPSISESTAAIDQLLDLQLERHRRSLRDNPNQADLHYRYGLLLRGKGDSQQAAKHFHLATQINGSYLKAKSKLGLVLRELNETNEALKQLTEAMIVPPEYVELHYKLGLLYCDKIRFALAVEHFGSAFNVDAENADVQANLGLALQNMGLVDRASASWRAVCELEPNSAMAYQSQRCITPLRTTY
ncbi:MAG: tetratricopeptide repeat protein [Sedimentisphaerales bacterium]|nr:tetratricopeptide repeat protein [Sedimentisphaerales bacterium]